MCDLMIKQNFFRANTAEYEILAAQKLQIIIITR